MTLRHLAAALLLTLSAPAARAQTRGEHDLAVGLRYSATRAQTLSGDCCFYLQGGAADVALPVLPHASAVVEVGGGTVSRVVGTNRGLSTITLFAGPRYTQPLGSRFSFSAHALFGAARGFDADFSSAGRASDTATAFGMALGGSAAYSLSRSLSLRVAQVDYLQTNLPNGADNRQRNLRLGAGIVFIIPLPQSRR